jgi:hypothetical protein
MLDVKFYHFGQAKNFIDLDLQVLTIEWNNLSYLCSSSASSLILDLLPLLDFMRDIKSVFVYLGLSIQANYRTGTNKIGHPP